MQARAYIQQKLSEAINFLNTKHYINAADIADEAICAIDQVKTITPDLTLSRLKCDYIITVAMLNTGKAPLENSIAELKKIRNGLTKFIKRNADKPNIKDVFKKAEATRTELSAYITQISQPNYVWHLQQEQCRALINHINSKSITAQTWLGLSAQPQPQEKIGLVERAISALNQQVQALQGVNQPRRMRALNSIDEKYLPLMIDAIYLLGLLHELQGDFYHDTYLSNGDTENLLTALQCYESGIARLLFVHSYLPNPENTFIAALELKLSKLNILEELAKNATQERNSYIKKMMEYISAEKIKASILAISDTSIKDRLLATLKAHIGFVQSPEEVDEDDVMILSNLESSAPLHQRFGLFSPAQTPKPSNVMSIAHIIHDDPMDVDLPSPQH